MPTLQDLVQRHGGFSTAELQLAIFEHPESNVLDAVIRCFGAARTANLRAAIAQDLGIELVLDSYLAPVPEVLSGVSPIELMKVLEQVQGLPLRFEQDGALRLAVADPLRPEVHAAFHALFQRTVRAVLVCEAPLRESIQRLLSSLALSVREERLLAADPSAQAPKLLEDPEVKKALQQLVASAVKHQAASVRIPLCTPVTAAQFAFGDGLESAVEMRVPSEAVLASVLRRGQILSESPRGFLGVSRVRFKSVTVNFDVKVEWPVARQLEGATLRLERFVLDNPDNPAFWFGIGERGRQGIRQMLESPSGLFFVTSARSSTRDFVLRSLADSFPDLIILKAQRVLELDSEIVSRAAEQRVLVGFESPDIFPLLAQIRETSAEFCECLGGIVAFHQLPRNCPVCSGETPLDPRLQNLIASHQLPEDATLREGAGCQLCTERGAIGFWCACSFLDMRGTAGEALRGVCSDNRLLGALKEDGFVSLYEDALDSAARGIVPCRIAVTDCPQPPDEYRAFRSETPSEKAPVQPEPARVVAPRGSRDSIAPRPVPSVEPVRGRDAFLSRPRGQEPVEHAVSADDDSAFANLSLGEPGREEHGKNPAARDRALLLVIDDDPDQRAILRRVFELAGYSVEVAADGIDGIVSAVRLVPELIIVDFMMPELDGRETIRRLKQGATTREIPVVALTAYADPEVELGLLQAGADDFCPKSVSKQVLLKRIERLVER